MKPLAHLPCNVVVRLCTDEENVVSYWNDVDRQLEINLDILDDPIGEAAEIESVNRWLNYGVPMHRMREWGVHLRELDLIDEQQLSATQILSILGHILDVEKRNIPPPQVDWGAFLAFIKPKLAEVGPVYNPVTRRIEPWVNVGRLRLAMGLGIDVCCSVV
jgi:hypothetical protein